MALTESFDGDECKFRAAKGVLFVLNCCLSNTSQSPRVIYEEALINPQLGLGATSLITAVASQILTDACPYNI